MGKRVQKIQHAHSASVLLLMIMKHIIKSKFELFVVTFLNFRPTKHLKRKEKHGNNNDGCDSDDDEDKNI